MPNTCDTLCGSLPDAVLYNDREIKFNTDYRTWLGIEKLLLDDDIAPDMCQLTAVKMIFPDEKYSGDLFRFIVWFYRCGEPPKECSGGSRRAYDVRYDGAYIYAAFYQQYGIDLVEMNMHWWKYRALFKGLKDTKFNDITGWRASDIDVDMPESRKQFLYDMQELYELPITSIYEQQRYTAAKAFYGE